MSTLLKLRRSEGCRLCIVGMAMVQYNIPNHYTTRVYVSRCVCCVLFRCLRMLCVVCEEGARARFALRWSPPPPPLFNFIIKTL